MCIEGASKGMERLSADMYYPAVHVLVERVQLKYIQKLATWQEDEVRIAERILAVVH